MDLFALSKIGWRSFNRAALLTTAPISSAHARKRPCSGRWNTPFIAAKNGSAASAKREPLSGHPCRTPDKIQHKKPEFITDESTSAIHEVHALHQRDVADRNIAHKKHSEDPCVKHRWKCCSKVPHHHGGKFALTLHHSCFARRDVISIMFWTKWRPFTKPLCVRDTYLGIYSLGLRV